MGRGKHKATVEIINTTIEILEESKFPLTLRRLYYELISKGLIENSKESYASVVSKITNARWDGDMPTHLLGKVIDPGRDPHSVVTWANVADYARSAARMYERDRWADQATYVELWVEKQAIVSLLTGVCSENQIVLRPCHGFNSFPALHQAAVDLLEIHKNITILWLGDHDVYGYEIEQDIQTRLREMFALLGNPTKAVEFRPRLGILQEDIGKFGIVPLQVEWLDDEGEATGKGGKKKQAKRDAFIAQYGNEAAEVDGLPAEELIQRVQDAIDDESVIDDRESWDNSLALTESDREDIELLLGDSISDQD
ncbi:MAG: hypothetical protein ABR881_32185 [Candidatus Sulfotelmatobacter sp.]|jgi:hypothetical protein